MREPQPAHIQRLNRSALGSAAPSYRLEMAYIAFSPRHITKAEKVRLPAQSSDRRDSLRPAGAVRKLGHGKGNDRFIKPQETPGRHRSPSFSWHIQVALQFAAHRTTAKWTIGDRRGILLERKTGFEPATSSLLEPTKPVLFRWENDGWSHGGSKGCCTS